MSKSRLPCVYCGDLVTDKHTVRSMRFCDSCWKTRNEERKKEVKQILLDYWSKGLPLEFSEAEDVWESLRKQNPEEGEDRE